VNPFKVHQYILPLVVALFLLSSCSAKTSSAPEEIKPIHSLLLMPVGITTEGSTDRTAEENKQLENGQAALNQLLDDYFKTKTAVYHATENMEESREQGYDRNRTQSALAMCRSLEKDAVLILTLQHYKEREGTEYSIISPASVIFEYKLILADNGQAICTGVFRETQKPVLENILEIFQRARRGLKWVTAEVLLKEGLEQKLENCQYIKQLP
jgi:hypothetical protein